MSECAFLDEFYYEQTNHWIEFVQACVDRGDPLKVLNPICYNGLFYRQCFIDAGLFSEICATCLGYFMDYTAACYGRCFYGISDPKFRTR